MPRFIPAGWALLGRFSLKRHQKQCFNDLWIHQSFDSFNITNVEVRAYFLFKVMPRVILLGWISEANMHLSPINILMLLCTKARIPWGYGHFNTEGVPLMCWWPHLNIQEAMNLLWKKCKRLNRLWYKLNAIHHISKWYGVRSVSANLPKQTNTLCVLT